MGAANTFISLMDLLDPYDNSILNFLTNLHIGFQNGQFAKEETKQSYIVSLRSFQG